MFGLTLLALLAFGALTAVAASAEEGVLPGAGSKYSVTGEKATLEDSEGKQIVCKKVEGKSELTTDTHSLIILDFTGCTAAGFPLNSLGDASGTILTAILALVCLVSSTALLFGLFLEIEKFLEMNTVHIEVPAIGTLIDVTGAVIGHILTAAGKKTTKFTVDLAGAKGEGNVKECVDEKGGVKKTNLAAETNHNGKPLPASEKVTNGLITFEKEVELMDT